MGRVGLGSSGNREDQPSPLSHNEGLITGPASLKSHGSRPPVSVLRSPNILIALLFSLCIYCASLPDSLLLSPQPFHTWKRDANCLLWKILGLWLARRRVWLARLCEGASSQQWRGTKKWETAGNSFFCHSPHARQPGVESVWTVIVLQWQFVRVQCRRNVDGKYAWTKLQQNELSLASRQSLEYCCH